MPELKICGVTDATFACEAARRGIGYIGFIFADGSPRRITAEKARETRGAVELDTPARTVPTRFVGVFVEQTADEIAEIAGNVPLDVIQLHGDYAADVAAGLKAKGYEVWAIDGSAASAAADAVLLDGRLRGQRGGTGCRADWSRVPQLKLANRRVVLAGGISAENIASAIATGADIIDANSSLETSPGVKSTEKLDRLLAQLLTSNGDGIPEGCKPTSPRIPRTAPRPLRRSRQE